MHPVPSGTGVWTHLPVVVSQESIVHSLLSLHCALEVQPEGTPIRLKLALKPTKGPSTMPAPLMPSPLKSVDIMPQTVAAEFEPHAPVHMGDGANTAFAIHTFTTSRSLLPPQSKSMWPPSSPAPTVKVIGAPIPQPGLPAGQPA
jgi:hypothetical protein